MYSSPISRIRLITEDGENKGKVEAFSASTGNTFYAKRILFTASLGVLKSGLVKFDPELPEYFTNALSRASMAQEIKVFLKFPSALVGKAIHRVIDAKDDASGGENALPKGFTSIWYNLNALPGKEGSNILMTRIVGDAAKAMNSLSEDEIKDVVLARASRLYSFDAKLVKTLVAKWNGPYTRGSKSGKGFLLFQ